jgi:enoyl-CoA hydratase/carnithine racemase
VIDTSSQDGVRIVRMDDGENRFNLPFVSALDEALEQAAATAGTGAPLVVTGSGKFFCNGLDLDWLGSAAPDDATAMFARLYDVLGRLLTFPGATVAAINGHAFGAGAVLAAAFDVRVMREDRGYFCFPEVDLGMTFSPEFDAVLRATYPKPVLREALLTGRRYGGPAAVARGLVDAVADEAGLVAAAVDRVRDLVDKQGAYVAALRAQMLADALHVLARPTEG